MYNIPGSGQPSAPSDHVTRSAEVTFNDSLGLPERCTASSTAAAITASRLSVTVVPGSTGTAGVTGAAGATGASETAGATAWADCPAEMQAASDAHTVATSMRRA